ncbi:MAG: archaemetzincin family Zn-dependent metalloprotease, partial [Halobacteria archaeon]
NSETTIAQRRNIPDSAYDPKRGQFYAHEFIQIAKQEEGEKNLAITHVDIYAKNMNFVFGQAELNGKACVVSIHRLRAESDGLLIKRACKEAIHELGHTFGLKHCSDKSCVMCFSSNIEGVDAKNAYFCSTCKEKYVNCEKVPTNGF